ncbi:MAG: hypothetical protein ACJAXY_001242 [Nonlabens sp.]|jgi:hypothetical protein|uniref:hypothetical protein n=1 Tax=Nonlabens sp. TaxID=1888209 RepID=UPI0039E21967
MLGSKIKWSIGLILVILLIVATNFIDRNNFQRIQDSVYSIYEDRLIAKNFIFDIQIKIHEKEMLLAQQKDSILASERTASQKTILGLVEGLSNTGLTREEKRVLSNLSEEVNSLFNIETTYHNALNKNSVSKRFKAQIKNISNTLSQLSDIQISEGKRQMQVGKKAMESIELLTQLEVWIMIFLGVLVQFIILYNPKKKVED